MWQATHYTHMFEKFLTGAKSHEQMKAGYQSNTNHHATKFKSARLDHCDYFIQSSRESAQQTKELAAQCIRRWPGVTVSCPFPRDKCQRLCHETRPIESLQF